MLRSKSRSGALDVGAKHHSSIVSRTLSASKICRGDPLIDKNALVSIERRPSARIISSSENQLVRVSTVQRRMERIEEELKLTKDQLEVAEEDRDRALDQLRDSKMMVHEANSRLSEALSPRKAEKVFPELTTVKELLSNSKKELAAKEQNIESMKLELDQVKQSENKLAEKVSSLSKMEDELRIARVSETRAMELCSESRRRVAVLEDELEKLKQSENKVFESGVSQTKELEAAKIELEESRHQIVSLREQLQNLQSSSAASSREQNGVKKSDHIDPTTEPGQKSATSKEVGPQSEIDVLKKQLKAAIEGEEYSTKAMNDLALALKEVATESNQTKGKLISTESELEHVKEEREHLKIMVRDTVDKYQKILDEEKKETELHKNTADRLRMEAEESFLAWNGKEMGFVDVIKKVEEEKACIQQQNVELTESLKVAEETSRTAREENHKLRDILKQALNESNVAKEAASIAQKENSELKNSLADKEEIVDSLTRENEKLRIGEVASNEKIKELNRLLTQAHSEQKTDDKDSGTAFMPLESEFDDHKEDYSKQHNEDKSKQHKEDYSKQEAASIKNNGKHHKEDHSKKEASSTKKGFSFDLHKIKLRNKFEDENEDKDDNLVDEDPVKADALKGSIFDTSTKTPKSEARTRKRHLRHHHSLLLPHHRKKSSLSDIESFSSDDLNHLDGDSHHDQSKYHKEDHSKEEASSSKKGFSFDRHKIKFHSKSEDVEDKKVDEDPIKDDALKGSIFDPSTKTPKSEAHTPKQASKHQHHHSLLLPHHRKKSSLSVIETLNSDDLTHLDGDSHHGQSKQHKEDYSKQEAAAIKNNSKHHKEDHRKQAAIKKGFSFDLHKMKFHNKFEDEDDKKVDEVPVKEEALKGSIFDLSTKTTKQASKHHHHHHHSWKKPSIENSNSVDLNNSDSDSQHDNEGTQSDESAHKKIKSVALKSFGYLLLRKNFPQHTSHENKESTNSSPVHE